VGSFPPGYEVGAEVPVYFDPDCPEKALIISRREWLTAWCFLAGGAAFAAAGIAIAVL
jgi:hypothetical protein